jgi:hypothetical protein
MKLESGNWMLETRLDPISNANEWRGDENTIEFERHPFPLGEGAGG